MDFFTPKQPATGFHLMIQKLIVSHQFTKSVIIYLMNQEDGSFFVIRLANDAEFAIKWLARDNKARLLQISSSSKL